jgi:hypothetical protein
VAVVVAVGQDQVMAQMDLLVVPAVAVVRLLAQL